MPLRCAHQANQLFDISRYVEGLRDALGQDPLLALITTVPPDLVSEERYRRAEPYDAPDRAEFYAAILADPRMQLGAASAALASDDRDAACAHARATYGPGRRLLAFAEQLGVSARVQSLCEDDLTTAVFRLLSEIDQRASKPAGCLYTRDRVPRDAAGLVPCRLTFELPAERWMGRPAAPVTCDEQPEFLSVPPAPRPQLGPHGGALCDVRQLPVLTQDTASIEAAGEGFYFDDFSPAVASYCGGDSSYGSIHVLFTARAKPLDGVFVGLHCETDGPRHESRLRGVPSIGAPCDRVAQPPLTGILADDVQCQPAADVPKSDFSNGMFCHPERHVCVRACTSDADCPAHWICDDGESEFSRTAGRAVCTNPSCED